MAFQLTKNPAKIVTPALVKPKGFLKTGEDAAKAMAAADLKSKLYKEKANQMYRFWMKAGDEATITFLNGALGEDGMFDVAYANEHLIKIDGKFENIICTMDQFGKCPMCEEGNRTSFVGYFTVIDHRSFARQDGTESVNRRKLFAANTSSLKLLAVHAKKRGPTGLSGVTFEVSRTGDKASRTGDVYDDVGQHSWEELLAEFGAEVVCETDYEAELPYYSLEELAKLGIGKKIKTIGGFGKSTKAADLTDEDVAY